MRIQIYESEASIVKYEFGGGSKQKLFPIRRPLTLEQVFYELKEVAFGSLYRPEASGFERIKFKLYWRCQYCIILILFIHDFCVLEES